uniref:Uncharacterized protein n=1 Tax=Shewanella eurypsychrophilus TaxID=2593656 RepID=A0A7S9IZW9_9GAMM
MNLFKKTLLASVVAAVSTGAMAIDVSSSVAQTYGAEALAQGVVANDGDTLFLGSATSSAVLTAGAEYSVGDIITITLTGGEFASDAAYTLTDTPLTSAGPLVNDTVTFGLLNTSKTELVFRVTALTPDGTTPKNSTIGNTFTLHSAGTVSATTAGLTVSAAQMIAK